MTQKGEKIMKTIKQKLNFFTIIYIFCFKWTRKMDRAPFLPGTSHPVSVRPMPFRPIPYHPMPFRPMPFRPTPFSPIPFRPMPLFFPCRFVPFRYSLPFRPSWLIRPVSSHSIPHPLSTNPPLFHLFVTCSYSTLNIQYGGGGGNVMCRMFKHLLYCTYKSLISS